MKKPSLKISYDAFQWNYGVEDFDGIDKFRIDIDKVYSSLVKANPTGRGGAAYQFIIDFFVNLSATEYLKVIGLYLGSKALDRAIDPLLDSYVFNPLKNAYQELKVKNPILDCYSITIELLDTKVYLYSVSPDSIIDNKDQILLALDTHFKNLVIGEEFPNEIHIPVYEELVGDKFIYRPPLGISETIETNTNNGFFKLWGLKYQYTNCSHVYDITNKQILEDTEFMTENDYDYYRQNNP